MLCSYLYVVLEHFQKEAPQQLSLPSWYWNFRSSDSDSNNNFDKDDERGLSEILRCVAKVPILKFTQRHPSLNQPQDWESTVDSTVCQWYIDDEGNKNLYDDL